MFTSELSNRNAGADKKWNLNEKASGPTKMAGPRRSS